VFYNKDGLKIDKKLLSKINKQRKSWIWVCAQKGNEVKITFNKIPEEVLNKQIVKPVHSNNVSVKNIPEDFYLYKREYGTWQGNIEVEINSNGDAIIRQMYKEQHYKLSREQICHLWWRLLKLGIFNLKNNYKDPNIVVLDGTSWELRLEGGGKRIQSRGINVFPDQWKDIVEAINECIQSKVNYEKKGEKKMNRGLSDTFMNELKRGLLSPILNLVLSDDSLIMEIRNDYINIYYRGGNILKIEKKGNDYLPSFDFNRFGMGNSPPLAALRKKVRILVRRIFCEYCRKTW
jgi:hypothetical protein